ncbi:fatty-acyl-CoA synthase [Nocardia amikacinitolerans]|uniref:acyl-CoA synthetase n=1 Tax=Nocardia amikacinitolerans TaxID=756689 RepID=UPI000A90578B|nr:acyl-CoA synthetase [Nocardia amikacinitolerans]MCP2321263.1 fatty-acyl-CoA synthase [Nocardia amikacinitolerans]
MNAATNDLGATARAIDELTEVPLVEHALPATIYDLLERSARRHGEKPALHLLPGGNRWDEPETWSYTELLRRTTRAANLYAALGLEPGGVVGLMLPNTGTTYAALLGAQAIGIANPVNPMLATEHIIEILRLTEARILVAPAPALDPASWDKACAVAEALPALRALVSVGGPVRTAPGTWVGDFEQLAATRPADGLTFERRPDASDIAAYFHTGGTTGVPKVAPNTHASEVYVAWALGQHGAFGGDTVVLTGLPLFHVNAILISTLAPFAKGGTVVSLGSLGFRDREAVTDFWRIVERYRVTTFSAVPTVYASLPPVPDGVDLSTLRAGIVGAAPLPSRVRAEFESATGVSMIEGYGLTEATCANTIGPMIGGKPGSIGLPLPYQQIKAVRIGTDGVPSGDCGQGEIGVLAIKGPSVFPGYLRPGPDGPVPDPTGVIVDGWLITGDLGRIDSDGFVHLTGRAKDIIIRGGHNIDPRLVEDAMLTHPDIVATAVVPCPDRHSGEVPAAYVVLRPGADPDPRELTAWAAQHAPEPAAVPKFIHTLPSIPLTAVGKVNKVALAHDSVGRVVSRELQDAQLSGEVTVSDRNGRPHAQIILANDAAPDRLGEFRERLNAYSFGHDIETSRTSGA